MIRDPEIGRTLGEKIIIVHSYMLNFDGSAFKIFNIVMKFGSSIKSLVLGSIESLDSRFGSENGLLRRP